MVPETVHAIMGILESSETLRRFESRRRNPVFALSQLFTVNLIRDSEGEPYANVKNILTDPLCEAMGLPRRKDGSYRKPSVGRLNEFVQKDWPRCSDGFGFEFAVAVIDRELCGERKATVSVDSILLRGDGSDRGEKAHIASIDGIPLFSIITCGTRNDCAEAGNLCRMLRSTARLWGEDVVFSMDAAYCTSGCLAEAFLTTGSIPHVVLRSDSTIHPKAEWDGVQSQYCRMFRLPDYDPRRKDDERFVLRFMCLHGKKRLVGEYLLNCEIGRQRENPPDGEDGICCVGERPRFDIRWIHRRTRRPVIAFKFNAMQILSAIHRRAREPSEHVIPRSRPGVATMDRVFIRDSAHLREIRD